MATDTGENDEDRGNEVAPRQTATRDDHDQDDGAEDDGDAPSPEAEARLRRLGEALASISLEDLDAVLRTSPPDSRMRLNKLLGIRLDPRFVKKGLGRLIRPKLAKLSVRGQIEVSAELTTPLETAGIELLGEDTYEHPSNDDLGRLVNRLLETWPVPVVRTYLACTAAAEAPVAEELDRLLDEDDRLAVAAPAPA